MINSLLKNKTRKQSVRRELELKHPTPSPPPPLSFLGGERIELPTKFKKKNGEGLDRISTFRGGCWERGG